MKYDPPTHPMAPATLQTVLDRIAADPALSDTRKRDLRSAVRAFAKLKGQPPAALVLDLAEIRITLDATVPAQVKVSRKRWSNLRSDLAAAINASGLLVMLKTRDLELSPSWARLLTPPIERRVRFGLSRFVRWASLHRIEPAAVDEDTIARFAADLAASSLVRNLGRRQGAVVASWNRLVALCPEAGLRSIRVPENNRSNVRLPWETLPKPLREDVARHLEWASVPDPLAEGARVRRLGSQSINLRREHIHSSVHAGTAAGIELEKFTSLAMLVEPDTVRVVLRQLWRQYGNRLSARTHGIAVTLVAIASEWVKLPTEKIAELKRLQSKLGTLPPGLTEKNRALLRKFDDPRLLAALVQLPDTLWHRARRGLATLRWPFIDLQNALAIDLLIHVPLRMKNLSAMRFDTHLHWPQGRHKPALVTFRADETKNDIVLEFEIPTVLADRLHAYRNEIAPAVTGRRPDAVFVTFKGKPRTQEAIKVAIEKTLMKHLGVKITPHQFRHLAAKIVLDANPGAYELVRQLLGHKNVKTTTNNYAGIDTRRAGRAHADLIIKIREIQAASDAPAPGAVAAGGSP